MQFEKGKQMKIITTVLLVFILAACGNTRGERAVSGGLLGAGGGAALGGITGLGAGTGALIGGAGGAGYGALTAPSRRNYYRGY